MSGIVLDHEDAVVSVGKTVSLKATIEPQNATLKKLEWSSSDEAVATVNGGKVKGIAPGNAVITAKATDESGTEVSVAITVVQPVKKIITDHNKLVLAPGVTWIPEITIEPEDATIRKLAWTSSNDKVANVDENGEISAVAAGSCNIIAAATDDSKQKLSISLQVKEHDVVILTPKEVHVDFDTRYASYGSYIQIGGWSSSETEEIIVTFKDGLVCEGSAEHTLRPLKAGSGTVEVQKKHNGRNSGKNTYTVFVAQEAVPIERDDEIGRMEAESYEGHTYQAFYSGRSWDEAEKFCEKHGGHLVTITTDKEQKFLERYLAKAEKPQSYWIGLNSGKNKQFTKWITGEVLKYSKWSEGNPDGNEPSYNCARIAASEYADENGWTMKRGTWDDVGGTYYSIVGFICEWDEENSPNVLPPPEPAAEDGGEASGTAELAPFTISSGEESPYGQELVLNAGTEKETVFTGYFIPAGKYSVTNRNADKAIKITVYDNVRQTIEGTEEFKKAKDKEAVMLFPGKSGELTVGENEFVLFSDDEFAVLFEVEGSDVIS